MRLIINGKEEQLEARNVAEVVRHLGLESRLIVTEVDGRIVYRDDWETTPVQDGMSLEIVHFVGGG